MARLRIFLAIHGGVLREGLRKLIDDQPGMTVVGEAADKLYFEKIATLQPDLAIVEPIGGHAAYVETARQLKKNSSKTKVLILSALDDINVLRRMAEAGVAGIALTNVAKEQLIDAINAVADGGNFYYPPLETTDVTSCDGATNHAATGNGSVLSSRETTVVRWVAEGYTNREIADKLHISIKSVETYRSRSMSKLGLHGRTDFVRYALEQGWLRQRSPK